MKVEKASYLQIRFDCLYSIYAHLRRAPSSSVMSGSCGACCAAKSQARRIRTKVSSGL